MEDNNILSTLHLVLIDLLKIGHRISKRAILKIVVGLVIYR